jgi:hypothetical protein
MHFLQIFCKNGLLNDEFTIEFSLSSIRVGNLAEIARMLIQFKVENFRSFATQQQFCMVASPDDYLKQMLIECDGFKLLRTAMIFGANASGKSNLLRAFGILRNFVMRSATGMNLGDKIPGMDAFRLDKKWRQSPCRFEIAVLIDGATYMYAVAATTDRVFSESLHVRKANGRTAKKLARNLNQETGETVWEIPGLENETNRFCERERERTDCFCRVPQN